MYTHQIDTLCFLNTNKIQILSQIRAIDHGSGSHGTAGIVIKYEFSPISAIVQVKEKNWVIFLTRMLGVVGGIISTSGLNLSSTPELLVSGQFFLVHCLFAPKAQKGITKG